MNTRIIKNATFGNIQVKSIYQGSELVWPLNSFEYETVDLGLPSGTLWAKYNIGARTPYGVGNLYAWAELQPKNVNTGTWENYIWYDASTDSLTGPYSGNAQIRLEDDIAFVSSSENLRIPSPNDFVELGDNCASEWTTINGVYGRKFYKPADPTKWIFFPETIAYTSPYPKASEYWTRASNIYATLPPNSTDTHSRSNKLAHYFIGTENGDNSGMAGDIYGSYINKCYALGVKAIALQGAPDNRISYTTSDSSSLDIESISTQIKNVGSKNVQNVWTVYYTNAVPSIPESYFKNKTTLTSITLPSTVQIIDSSAFLNCSSLTDINIPSGVATIGQAALCNCSSLTSIILPSSVQEIGRRAFAGCTSLTDINIPEGITTLRGTFSNCTSLENITFPSTLTTVSVYALNGTGLKTITFLCTTPPTTDATTMLTSIQHIYVPAQSVNAYKTASFWKNYANTIEAIPS